jgi:hypothetical protein
LSFTEQKTSLSCKARGRPLWLSGSVMENNRKPKDPGSLYSPGTVQKIHYVHSFILSSPHSISFLKAKFFKAG